MTTGESGEDQKSQIDKQLGNPAGSPLTVCPVRAKANIAMIGRPGSDADMAACILYLVGPGGLFLHGQTIYPDGGVSSPFLLASTTSIAR